jgi:hypothetical protein
MGHAGMIVGVFGVASSMTACSSNVCGAPGMVVIANAPIVDVMLSDVACKGVTATCQATDDAGTCTRYYVVPTATGNCHIDVDFSGHRFSADVTIVNGSGCPGFYPAHPSDSTIEAS